MNVQALDIGIAERLLKVSLFKDLDERELADIARNVRRGRYGSGEIVVQHLEEDDDVYVVLEGRLIATIISPDGREVAFDLMTDGDYFGEIAAIDGQGRSASVAALTPTAVGVISGAKFRSLVDGHPKIASALVRDLVGRVRRLTERNYENIALRIKHRVQLELLRLANKRGVLHDGGILTEAPTHAQIAARVGANREAVTRELSTLAKRGLIKASRQSITILDADGLIEEANADFSFTDR
ncbi:MAG TPA: Crp/Fnr family transcriptional regulator [Alphaproteobacteria bacterium]|nr:Crp/Fnr family transcriptional regulator [Alphaproteobacteria bacterium]